MEPAGTDVDRALVHYLHHLHHQMEMVPDPVMEDHETSGDRCCMVVCVELGKTFVVGAEYIPPLRSNLF